MKKIISIVFVAAALFGCMVGPKYTRPSMPAPSAYHEANSYIVPGDSIANLKWFDLFKDPTLKSLLDTTLKRNFNLKIAVARIDQATETYGIAKAQLLPSLGYSAGATESFGNNGSGNTFSLGAGLSWEIDLWGKIRHAKRAALDDLLASQEGKKVVQSALVASMAGAYFQLRDYDNRLKISMETRTSREAAYEIQKDRFDQGYISEWDVLQAKQLVADAEASIAAYQRARSLVEHFMCTLMAVPPTSVSRGLENAAQPLPPAMPGGLPSTLLEQRPDVKQAEYSYMREVERIGIAQAQRFPTLNLSGAIGFGSNSISSLVTSDAFAGSVSQGLLGPIFEFGKNKRRVTAQQKAAEIAALQYQSTYITAIQEVEDALVSIETLTNELAARNRQLESASKVVILSQARYDNGVTSYLELLDAQRTLFETQLLVSTVQQQQLNAYVDLYRALGGGW